MIRCRSSAVPHSLLVVDPSCCHNSWCLCCSQMEQSWRMWWAVCSASLQSQCRVHDANSLQKRSQATVSCSQPEYSGLLMPCQTVDWVYRGVVVSSGPSPLACLTVSEQRFGFLVSLGRQGLYLLLVTATSSSIEQKNRTVHHHRLKCFHDPIRPGTDQRYIFALPWNWYPQT